MTRAVRRYAFALVALLSMAACASTGPTTPVAGPLPSWNETAARAAIVGFVEGVTDEGDPRYVPPEERIAAFDNDGTLWVEQPLYSEVLFALDQIHVMAPDHPNWQTEEPYASVLSGDQVRVAALDQGDLVKIVAVTHSGMTASAFEADAKRWFASARHPTLHRPYPSLAYQPQLELLHYLRANGFKTFIVSGGEADFMRAFVPETYGIPPERVMGTTFRYAYRDLAGQPVLDRLPELALNGDGIGKPVNIQVHIGRKPILAFGNSDGDLQMLEYTAGGDGPHMLLLLHHDDAAREFAYDRQSSVGRLDKAWDAARQHGWTVVSMKDDFKTIFPGDAAPDAPGAD